MKTRIEEAANRSIVCTRLDTIRMSETQRRHACASMRDGELIAGLVLRAAADLHAASRGVEHAAFSLAGAIKTMLAKPVKH